MITVLVIVAVVTLLNTLVLAFAFMYMNEQTRVINRDNERISKLEAKR